MSVHMCLVVLLLMLTVGDNVDSLCNTTTAQPPTTSKPQCNCPNQPSFNVTCNCVCNAQNTCASQDPTTCECRDPLYGLCFNPLSNSLHFTGEPLTLAQGAFSSPGFISTTERTPLTLEWDGVCATQFKLTKTLYLQITTITYIDSTYDSRAFLIADQGRHPGSFVATRNTPDARSFVDYRTIIGTSTISNNTFLGIYSFSAYGSCYEVKLSPRFFDLTVYPTLIPQSARIQAASELLGKAKSIQILPYKNTAYCVTIVNGMPCINSQTSSPATPLSWPPN